MSLSFEALRKVDYIGTEIFIAPEMYFKKVKTSSVDMFSFGATCCLLFKRDKRLRKVDWDSLVKKLEFYDSDFRTESIHFLYGLNKSSSDLSELLKQLIQWSPEDRLTIKELLKQPIILTSLEAWKKQAKSELFVKRKKLFEKQVRKVGL